jgi:hypothetical protein
MDEQGSDDAAPARTVLERLLAAGSADERARAHLQAARVQVDGETVTDPQHPASPPARIVISGSLSYPARPASARGIRERDAGQQEGKSMISQPAP